MADYIPLAFVALYAALKILEAARPGRVLPRVKGWHVKGALFFILYLALSSMLPLLWDGYLGQYRLIDATGLGTWFGALAGVLTLQLFSYWWHRAMHNVPFLWRWFHQMHHSAERIDIAGAFYFHPFDAAGFTFVGSLALVLVLGVSGEAALIANVFTFFCAVFQHANVKTPRWLGYLIQRPENHAAHHERGVHAQNYGDIPFWDIVFGTFKNPEAFPSTNGFYDGASSRVRDMLLGRDISPREQPELGEPVPAE